jgi:hypothetical protein
VYGSLLTALVKVSCSSPPIVAYRVGRRNVVNDRTEARASSVARLGHGVRCSEEAHAMDRVFPSRNVSRSQLWMEHRLISFRGSSTNLATAPLAGRPCAPSPVVVLPASSLVSGQGMLGLPARGRVAAAQVGESAARD